MAVDKDGPSPPGVRVAPGRGDDDKPEAIKAGSWFSSLTDDGKNVLPLLAIAVTREEMDQYAQKQRLNDYGAKTFVFSSSLNTDIQNGDSKPLFSIDTKFKQNGDAYQVDVAIKDQNGVVEQTKATCLSDLRQGYTCVQLTLDRDGTHELKRGFLDSGFSSAGFGVVGNYRDPNRNVISSFKTRIGNEGSVVNQIADARGNKIERSSGTLRSTGAMESVTHWLSNTVIEAKREY